MKVFYCDICNEIVPEKELQTISFFDVVHLCKTHYDEYMKLCWDARCKLKGIETQEEKIDEFIDKVFGGGKE